MRRQKAASIPRSRLLYGVSSFSSQNFTLSEFSSWKLQSEHSHKLPHGGGGLLQRGVFFRRQLDLNDFFDAVRAELHGHAHEQPFDPVFTFEIDGARQNLFLVLEDRF